MQKIPRHSLIPTYCHISVVKKVKPDNLFLDVAHHSITDGEFCSVWYTPFGCSLLRLCNFVLFTDPNRENLHSWENQSFRGALHHFLSPFDNTERNYSFSLCSLPFAMLPFAACKGNVLILFEKIPDGSMCNTYFHSCSTQLHSWIIVEELLHSIFRLRSYLWAYISSSIRFSSSFLVVCSP